METITKQDTQTLKIILNEFLITNKIDSPERIPIELLKYLRQTNRKIEDGELLNELYDLIQEKTN